MAAVAIAVAIEGEAVWYDLFSILYYACLEGMGWKWKWKLSKHGSSWVVSCLGGYRVYIWIVC